MLNLFNVISAFTGMMKAKDLFNVDITILYLINRLPQFFLSKT